MSEPVRQARLDFRLPHLVHLAETGRLRPGPFSRPKVWSAQQATELFDSILRGYPIGTLVVIEQPADEETFLLGNVLIHAPYDEHAWILVDGLQRVNTLFGALSKPGDQNRDDQFDVYYDLGRDIFLSSPPTSDLALPMRIAINHGRLMDWLRDRPFLSEAHIDACWKLSDALDDYTLSIIQLTGHGALETSQVIFMRLNASGVQLTPSDLARAERNQRAISRSGLGSLQLQTEQSGFGYLSTGLTALCALALVNGREGEVIPTAARDLSPEQIFYELPTTIQKDATDRVQKVLAPALKFLRGPTAIPHVKLLPQGAVLPALLKFLDIHGTPRGRAQELLKRWVWRMGTVQDTPLDQSLIPSEERRVPLTWAMRLLDSLPRSQGLNWEPDLLAADLNTSNGRLNTLGLLSLRPSLLVDSEGIAESTDVPLSATQIIAPWLDSNVSAFCRLLPEEPLRGRPESLGNYVLHPPAPQAALLHSVMFRSSIDTDALERHCIDQKAVSMLVDGRLEEFAERRAGHMHQVIVRRVQSMARWGFRDSGSLPSVPGSSPSIDGNYDEF
jgi:hypothetical protein